MNDFQIKLYTGPNMEMALAGVFWLRRDDQQHVNLLSYPNYVHAETRKNAKQLTSSKNRQKSEKELITTTR